MFNEDEAGASQAEVADVGQDELREVTGVGQARDAEDAVRIMNVQQLLGKIQVSDRTQAAVWAVRKELV